MTKDNKKTHSDRNPLVGEYFKKARVNHNYSLREAAEKVGISHHHIWIIEEKGIVPGFNVLVKLLNAYSLTIEDFSQKTGYHYVCNEKQMPEKFRERLKNDLKATEGENAEKIKDALKYPPEFLQRVVNGKAALSEKEVIELSILLKQPTLQYLELSEYLPQEFKALKHEGAINLLRAMDNLSVDEIITVIAAITNMLKISFERQSPRPKDGA